jgi:hypothetical protein
MVIVKLGRDKFKYFRLINWVANNFPEQLTCEFITPILEQFLDPLLVINFNIIF